MDEKIFTIVGNDTDAPRRYFDTFRRSEHLEPEKGLILAILEDAIHLYQKYRGARDRAGKERFREVDDWFMGESRQDQEWLFSFETICGLLGLDAQYVRRGLRESQIVPPSRAERRGGRKASHREAA